MIIVNSLNESRFTLNGIQYFKNYTTRIAGNSLTIYNVYDNKDVLVSLTPFDQFQVNGSVYDTIEELQIAIIGICYMRTTLNEGSPYDQNNIGRLISVGTVIPTWNGIGSYTFPAAANYTVDVADKLNNYQYIITANQAPVVISANIITDIGTISYKYLFKGGKGTWGVGGAQIEYYVLEYINQQNLTAADVQENPATNIITLGTLPDGDYLAAANAAEHDFSDSGTLDTDGNVISYYFSYITDSVLYFVQFIGSAGIYNGNLTEDDLVSSTNDEIAPDIIPDLQQVLDQGSTAIVSGGIVMTSDDGSDVSILSLGTDVAGLQHNDTYISVENDIVIINSPVQGSDAIEDNQFVTLGQITAATEGYIPLSGTEIGNPVTGDIEIEGSLSIINTDIFFSDGSDNLFGLDKRGFYKEDPTSGNQIRVRFPSSITNPTTIYFPDEGGTLALESYVNNQFSNAIPLTGTELGSPVTGDIEFDASSTVGLYAGAAGQITFDNTDGVNISGNACALTISGSAGGVNLYGVNEITHKNGDIPVDAPNGGFKYLDDYSALFINRSLVDKEYVDNRVGNAIPLTGTEEGNPITGDIEFDASTEIGLKANAGGQITFDNTSGVSINGNAGGISLYGSIQGINLNGGGGNIDITANSDYKINLTRGINHDGGGYNSIFFANGGQYEFGGLGNFKGIEYTEDYSDNYTNRSLVDKEYVDGQVDNAIPLTGTEVGNPVTGDIQVSLTGETSSYGSLGVRDDIISLESVSGQNTVNPQGFTFNDGVDSAVLQNTPSGVLYTTTNSTAVGFYSDIDFTSNIDALHYVQKKYVDDQLSAQTLQSITNNGSSATLSTDFVINTSGLTFQLKEDGDIFFGGGGEFSASYPYVNWSFGSGSIGFGNATLDLTTEPTSPSDVTNKAYVDTRIAEKAPQILHNNCTDSAALTGTTAQTVMDVYTASANSLSAGVLTVSSNFAKTGTNGTVVFKMYLNSSPDLTGTPTQIAAWTLSSNLIYTDFNRDFILKPDGTIWGFTANGGREYGGSIGTAGSTNPFDFETDNHIIITAALSNSADSIVRKLFKVKFEKATE